MGVQGSWFVTSHACRQFQGRIAPLSYEAARQAILHGLVETTAAPKPLQSGAGVMIRVRRPYAFRAVIVRGKGPLPAVATILKSGKRGKNARSRTGMVCRGAAITRNTKVA